MRNSRVKVLQLSIRSAESCVRISLERIPGLTPAAVVRPVQVGQKHGDEFEASYSKFSTEEISPFLDLLLADSF